MNIRHTLLSALVAFFLLILTVNAIAAENVVLTNSTQAPPTDNADGVPDVAFADPPDPGTLTIEIADVEGFSELYLQATNNIDVDNALAMAADGSIFFEANNDINADAVINVSGAGSVDLNADNDINVNANITAAGTGTISLTADNDASGAGAITRSNNSVLSQATGTMTLQAGSGIDAVTDAVSIDFSNSTSGDVVLDEVNSVSIEGINSGGGLTANAGETLVFSGNVTTAQGGAGVSVRTPGMIILDAISVESSNQPISLVTNILIDGLTSTINAGVGTVVLKPFDVANSIAVCAENVGNGCTSVSADTIFDLKSYDITAGQLRIGGTEQPSDISIGATVLGVGQSYDLVLQNGGPGSILIDGNFVGQGITLDSGAGGIALNSDISTNGGDVILADAVMLGNNLVIDSGGGLGGDVDIQGAVTGISALTVDAGLGTVSLGDIGLPSNPLASLQASGSTINLSGDIHTEGPNGIVLNGAKLLTGDVTLTATNERVQLSSGSVVGIGDAHLTTSGGGGINVNTAIGGFTFTNAGDGDVVISEVDALTVAGENTGGSISVEAGGILTVGPGGLMTNGGDVALTGSCVEELGSVITNGGMFNVVEVDPDCDGDGVLNVDDNCPTIPNVSQANMDGDAAGDACDAFPADANETRDADNDGVGDNSDALPNDPSETNDSDGDGTGNNADTDDDNDGILDSQFANITTIADITGDSIPDLAGFADTGSGKPGIDIYSGATGDWQATYEYANDQWQGFALGTVSDADQNGNADDPAIAMLIVNKTTDKIRVETRRSNTGTFLSSIQFLNENWRVIDVVVVDDTNGDGNTNDTAIGVLAERISDGRIQLQLRDLVSGALVSNVVYLTPRWTPIAAAVVDRSAMAPAGTLPPLIGVIAEKPEDGRRVLQSRVADTGIFDRNVKFLGSSWDYLDVSVNHDANGDGANDDPIWQVLATRASDRVIRVQSRDVSDGKFDSNIVILNSNWEGMRLDTAPDIDGNAARELVISATRRADDVKRIHVKDFASRNTTINVAP